MESKKKTSIPTEAITRSTAQMAEQTGNLYETVMVIAKRANQIASEQQSELKAKLEEVSKGATDTIEEVYENAEQIEVSRCYERLPKATLVATEEYNDGELHFHLQKDRKN